MITKGFALVDVFSPCVTYNKDNTHQWFNPRLRVLEDQGHDPTQFHRALDEGYRWGDEVPIGLFWKRTDLPSLEDLEPVLHRTAKGRWHSALFASPPSRSNCSPTSCAEPPGGEAREPLPCSRPAVRRCAFRPGRGAVLTAGAAVG